MTADEISKAIHAASLHLAQKRGGGNWKIANIAQMHMHLSSAASTVEDRYDTWDKSKMHIAHLSAFVAMEAMQIVGKNVTADNGLDAIHGVKHYAGSKWSKAELERDIRAIGKFLAGGVRTGKDEGAVMAEVVGRCRSICEGIGQDLFGFIERELAKLPEAK